MSKIIYGLTKTKMDKEALIKKIIDCAYNVRRELTSGYLEEIYKKAMIIELMSAGLSVEKEVSFDVNYKGQVIGQYRADIIVEKKVIVELKAVKELTVAHNIQLVNYLTCTGIDDGLLINFGSLNKLEVKRKYRTYIYK